MKINNYLAFLLGMLLSASPYAANMEGVPSKCRIAVNGDLQVFLYSNSVGSNTCSSLEVRVFQSTPAISVTTVNRYLAMCLNAKATVTKLRMDYLTCSSGKGIPTAASSFQFKR